MGVRGVARPEADIARRVREVVGRDAFIAGTFDPHGNEDAEFLRQADFAFCVKYFPHYDSRLQGERAARMLIRAIRGDYTPATVTVKVPILTATVLQWTGASPWMDLVQRALVWEAREPDLYMNVFFGFPFADVPDVGMTVQAMTNGKPELARKAADDVAAWAWRRREALLKTATVHPIPEGVKLAKEAVARGAWPVVLADHSDRSGSATWILQQVIAQDLSDVLIATIADRKAVEAVEGQGSEGRRSVRHGGGRPGRRVRRRSRSGSKGTIARRGAHLRQATGSASPSGEAIVVLLSEYLTQVMDPADLAGLRDSRSTVQGLRDQVARALPPRLRRFGLRQDHPAGRARAAVPRHGPARRAALQERRRQEVLSLRRRQLPLGEVLPPPASRGALGLALPSSAAPRNGLRIRKAERLAVCRRSKSPRSPTGPQSPFEPAAFRPLERLRVLDFTHVVAGPTIGKLLAEHGADVIHCRYPYQDHILGFDVDTSFGKKNTYMDLRSDVDRARVLELVRECDVFVQGFRWGSFARRGFGPEELQPDQPAADLCRGECLRFPGRLGRGSPRPVWTTTLKPSSGEGGT